MLVASMDLPPPGWPHTEAAKHGRTPGIPVPGKAPAGPPVGGPAPKSRGCGCLTGLLIVIAVLGVAAAVLVPVMDRVDGFDLTNSAEEVASAVFVSDNPDWYVEATDRPDDEPESVRLVAWNDTLGIGRIVLMDPDPSSVKGWIEAPVLPPQESGIPPAQEALLAGFAAEWSAVEWAYIERAEPVDTTVDPEEWTVRYRLWEESTGAWTEKREAAALRTLDDRWTVAGPDGVLERLEPGESATP